MIKYSIVTVCKNAEASIAKTIESVLNQTYTQYEYIVVDGLSIDKTVAVVDSFNEDFQKKNIAFKVLSQQDAGIYDAMNKGISMAEGEYILFLNSGDRFFDAKVLSEALPFCDGNNEVVYGDTYMSYPFYCFSVMKKALKLELIKEQMVFCHQSSFVKTDLLKEKSFDIRYKLAADYERFLAYYLEGKTFAYCEKLIALYDGSGVSSLDECRMGNEYNYIRLKHGVINKSEYSKEKYRLEELKISKKKWKRIKNRIPGFEIIRYLRWFIRLRVRC